MGFVSGAIGTDMDNMLSKLEGSNGGLGGVKNDSGKGSGNDGKVAQDKAGKQVINLDELINPQLNDTNSPSVWNMRNPFDFATKINQSISSTLKKVLKPLDGLIKKSDGVTNGALGGLFSYKTDENGNFQTLSDTISEKLYERMKVDDNIVEEVVTRLDREIIAEKLPFLAGLLPGYLSQFCYMGNAGGNYAQVDMSNAKSMNDMLNFQRVLSNQANAVTNFGPMLMAEGINANDKRDYVFASKGFTNLVGDGNLTKTYMDMMMMSNPNAYGGWINYGTDPSKINPILNGALGGRYGDNTPYTFTRGGLNIGIDPKTGLVKQDETLSQILLGQSNASFDYWVKGISDNLRRQHKTYDDLLNLAEAADPFWDKENRHDVYYNTLDRIKEVGTTILDGSGDFLLESWDNISEDVRGRVEDTVGGINEKLGQLGLQLNPNLQKKADKFLGKLGFTKAKSGYQDMIGYPQTEIIFSWKVTINGVELPPECFIGYYEEHDYMNAKAPIRELKVLIMPEMKAGDPNIEKALNPAKIDKDTKWDVSLARFYGYTVSQNYAVFTLDGNATYLPAEVINHFEGVPTLSKWSEEVSREVMEDWVENQDPNQLAAAEVITINLYSPLEKLMGSPKDKVQGQPKKDLTIDNILTAAFIAHFHGINDDLNNESTQELAGMQATNVQTDKQETVMQLVTPNLDTNTNLNTILTPMDFPATVEYFQKETGGKLFDGGYNIFQDANFVYIINKQGPNKIEFEDDWDFTFRIHPKEYPMQELYVTLSRDSKFCLTSIMATDIQKLGNMQEYNDKKETIVQSGSSVTLTGETKGSVHNNKAISTHTNAMVIDPTEIKPNEEFLIRVPNIFYVFRPGDQVKLEFIDEKEGIFTGTVKKWAAEQNQEVRCVLVWVTVNPGDNPEGEDADIKKNPINKALKKYKEKTAKWSTKFQEKIEKWKAKYAYASHYTDYEKNKSFYDEHGHWIASEDVSLARLQKWYDKMGADAQVRLPFGNDTMVLDRDLSIEMERMWNGGSYARKSWDLTDQIGTSSAIERNTRKGNESPMKELTNKWR